MTRGALINARTGVNSARIVHLFSSSEHRTSGTIYIYWAGCESDACINGGGLAHLSLWLAVLSSLIVLSLEQLPPLWGYAVVRAQFYKQLAPDGAVLA